MIQRFTYALPTAMTPPTTAISKSATVKGSNNDDMATLEGGGLATAPVHNAHGEREAAERDEKHRDDVRIEQLIQE